MTLTAATPLFIALLISVAATTTTSHIISTAQPDHSLIHEACNHAGPGLRDLCISSLSAKPESAAADLRLLAIISVRVAVDNTSQTASYLAAQQANATMGANAASPMLFQCVNDCMELYVDAVEQLDTTTAAIDDGADSDALIWLEAAAADVSSCEKGCGAEATAEMNGRNDGAKKLLNISLSLAKLLLASK